MTLPLPRCAKCGLTVARLARFGVETSLPGAPTVYWHEGCSRDDALCTRYMRYELGPGELVAAVLKRGKDRVRAGRLFWASRKAVR